MSFLHIYSSKCLKSELDLFSLPPTQTSIESSQWIYYKPVTSLEDAPIEFVVPSHGEDYLDLTHTMLSLRIRVETLPHTRNRVNPHQRGQSRPCKSFITFYVQSNRRIF